MAEGAASGRFGTCCEDLKEVLEAEDFDPLVYVGEDDVLYMSVGILDPDGDNEEDGGFLDHPVYHCPFCGTKLQSVEEVDGKIGDNDNGED